MTISPIFHNARPEGELPPQESAAFDLLDTLGIGYDRVSHHGGLRGYLRRAGRAHL